jgi:hypothetical protein
MVAGSLPMQGGKKALAPAQYFFINILAQIPRRAFTRLAVSRGRLTGITALFTQVAKITLEKFPKPLAYELNVSVKTIETQQMRIKEKLGLGSAAELRYKAREWLARAALSRMREAPELELLAERAAL